MAPETIVLDERSEGSLPGTMDGLIAGYFDRAFLVFNLFEDDPRTCLQHAQGVFRSLNSRHGATERDFYGELVVGVRRLPRHNEFLPGIGADGVLCWLLKDSADFSYGEIGTLMELPREAVREHIADVRLALLG
jgi:hypothetical protein